jgi:pteridine reductase
MKKNILITGSARRIGAACIRYLHEQGHNLILHYHTSEIEAHALADQLNQKRPDSIRVIRADLSHLDDLTRLAQEASNAWGGLDALINNASAFYPQPIQEVTLEDWDILMDSNLKAPFFLIQQALPFLKERQGCVINIIDIHAERGLAGYPVYSMAKAGLAAMTRILAKDLGPEIRVNGVSPGAVLWPEQDMTESQKQDILERIALKRTGEPFDIARTVHFLLDQAPYITGQIIAVDGGRTLHC